MSLNLESESIDASIQPAASAHASGHDQREREQLAAALRRTTPRWKPLLFCAVLLLVAVALVAAGALPRAQRPRQRLSSSRSLRALARRVTIAPITLAPATRTLTLPASLRPNASTDLFAQATGYVRERRVDIGQSVAAGDVLAILDVPLLDEQLNSARAALAEAEAARNVLSRNLDLAKTTLERWKSVDPPGAVSQQELDEKHSAFESASASLAAGEAAIVSRRADVQRLEQGQAFARILAPFAGTITARNLEVGDYVSGAGSGPALFRIADSSTLRAYVDVPQSFAAGVVAGSSARVKLREQPGQSFQGTIARTSGALDERTRTLHVEIRVPNEKGALLSGSYAEVELELARALRPVIVPGAALLVRAEGPRVAVVDAENHLRYLPVQLGRDLGSEVEITQGLTGDERVVVNMADELAEGSLVEAIPLPVAAAPAKAK